MFQNSGSIFHGELVKKVTACTLFVLLGLVFPVSPGGVARADTSSQRTVQKDAQKSQKKYMKQQRKEQKKARKSQKKAMNDWKKQHPTAH